MSPGRYRTRRSQSDVRMDPQVEEVFRQVYDMAGDDGKRAPVCRPSPSRLRAAIAAIRRGRDRTLLLVPRWTDSDWWPLTDGMRLLHEFDKEMRCMCGGPPVWISRPPHAGL